MLSRLGLMALCMIATTLVCPAAAQDQLSFTRDSIHPRYRELSNEGAHSDGPQGIAFDGSRWFYANRTTVFRLSADFRDSDRRYRIAPRSFLGGDGLAITDRHGSGDPDPTSPTTSSLRYGQLTRYGQFATS